MIVLIRAILKIISGWLEKILTKSPLNVLICIRSENMHVTIVKLNSNHVTDTKGSWVGRKIRNFWRYENSPNIPPRYWSINVEILHKYGIYSLPLSCRPCSIHAGHDSCKSGYHNHCFLQFLQQSALKAASSSSMSIVSFSLRLRPRFWGMPPLFHQCYQDI